MPELMVSVSKGFVDGGMISAPSNLRGIKMGLRELVDAAEYGIPYVNSPLSTRRSFIKTDRDTVLRVLRAYYEAVQETRNDKTTALKILAKYVRVDDPEILNEVYRSYGQKHLQKTIRVDLAGVRGLLKGLDKEALQFTPGSFVDASLYEELEREGFFKRSSVE
jgi:ABC-type nitrate/sulfonate/bicarbonate transport system substrate-binding protein